MNKPFKSIIKNVLGVDVLDVYNSADPKTIAVIAGFYERHWIFYWNHKKNKVEEDYYYKQYSLEETELAMNDWDALVEMVVANPDKVVYNETTGGMLLGEIKRDGETQLGKTQILNNINALNSFLGYCKGFSTANIVTMEQIADRITNEEDKRTLQHLVKVMKKEFGVEGEKFDEMFKKIDGIAETVYAL